MICREYNNNGAFGLVGVMNESLNLCIQLEMTHTVILLRALYLLVPIVISTELFAISDPHLLVLTVTSTELSCYK
jgi:hypothetical protein